MSESSTSNIVSLDGRAFTPPDAPQVSATLVGELERLLEAARGGEIVGMAGSFIHSDRLVSYSFAGAVGGFGVIGGLECLKERLVRHALTTD
jgi:hypothetical protein